MKALLALLAVAAPAHADLYRWVDPETGSVKFSSLPPADPHLSAALLPYTTAAPKPSAGAPSPEQARAYQALRRQLDLLDPAGARRRAAESARLPAK